MPTKTPFFYPFQRFSPFSSFIVAATDSGIQSLTNAQKLSLPGNTPVGTQVQVTDRSNSFSITFNGVYTDGDPYGSAENANPSWAFTLYAGEANLADSTINQQPTDFLVTLGAGDNPTATQLAAKAAALCNATEGLSATSSGPTLTVYCAVEGFIPFAAVSQGNYDAVTVLGPGIIQELIISDPSNEAHWQTVG